MADRWIEMFNERVVVGAPDECWGWQGTVRGDGYPVYQHQRRQIRAHRVAFKLATGIEPGDLDVCHTCDNPPCCNPAHLFLGTKAENQHDKKAKGRQARGEGNGGGGKLTVADVVDIRVRLLAGESYASIGRQFGVSKTMVSFIKHGRQWSHV